MTPLAPLPRPLPSIHPASPTVSASRGTPLSHQNTPQSYLDRPSVAQMAHLSDTKLIPPATKTVPRTHQFVSVMAVSPVQERYKMGEKWHTLSHSSQPPANPVPALADAKLARTCAGPIPVHGYTTGVAQECHGKRTRVPPE